MKLLRTLQELSKSGIVVLVLISVLGGYLIGQHFESPLEWRRLFLTLFGVLFLASGSSALNQYQERHIDATMPRTARRPLPSGRLTPTSVIGFVVITVALGLALLSRLGASLLILGIAALVSYNGLYTLWWKRRWAYAAIPGAIPGALPILMGHEAAHRNLASPSGWYLFFVLFFWQMPHFWVLALKFREDYAAGGFPTLPVARGIRITVARIVLWCLGYVGLALIAPLFFQVGWTYVLGAGLVSVTLLVELVRFARLPETGRNWLKFFLWINFSLILYLGFLAADLWAVYLQAFWTSHQ
jgi:protoheme IX farnesyltransferase